MEQEYVENVERETVIDKRTIGSLQLLNSRIIRLRSFFRLRLPHSAPLAQRELGVSLNQIAILRRLPYRHKARIAHLCARRLQMDSSKAPERFALLIRGATRIESARMIHPSFFAEKGTDSCWINKTPCNCTISGRSGSGGAQV